MKKIAYVGQIVGKYTKNIWENGKKTDDSKKYIQLLDTDTNDETKNTIASLTTIKVSEKTFTDLELNAVIEIDVREWTNEKGETYYTELDK